MLHRHTTAAQELPHPRDRRPSAHVVVELDVADGWPPVGAERVWAHSLGADRYVIDNPPWFVPDLAVGDIVRAVPPDPRAHPVFQELLHRSDHVTFGSSASVAGPLGGDLAAAKAPFTRLGVYAEGAAQFGMLALDVTPADPLEQLIAVLRAGLPTARGSSRRAGSRSGGSRVARPLPSHCPAAPNRSRARGQQEGVTQHTSACRSGPAGVTMVVSKGADDA